MLRFLLPVSLLLSACTTTREFAQAGYTLPRDRPIRILVIRPDVEVGSLNAGGVLQPNAEWTEQARAALIAAIEANQRARGNGVTVLPDQNGDRARLVADYQNLHETVAATIAQFKYGTLPLPTKKRETFDWTLGPGVARLGEIAPGDYALFLLARDSFATTERVALQVIGLAGCVIGLCAFSGGGERFAYASLVDLKTGDIVWFNVLQSQTGDMRTGEGAKATVDSLFKSLPVHKEKAR